MEDYPIGSLGWIDQKREEREAREAQKEDDPQVLDDTLTQLLQREDAQGDKLTQLSKNANKNGKAMDALIRDMQETDAQITKALELKNGFQSIEKNSRRAELEQQQAPLLAKIYKFCKEPSKYAAQLEELGKQVHAIDEQIAEVENE